MKQAEAEQWDCYRLAVTVLEEQKESDAQLADLVDVTLAQSIRNN